MHQCDRACNAGRPSSAARGALIRLLIALLVVPLSVAAQGQTIDGFPQRTVRIVVAQTAGGASDVLARLLAEQLQVAWKQPVIVDNRAGAAGSIAASYSAKQPADGHTLFVGSAGIMAIAPQLAAQLPYSPAEFVPLIHLASLPNVILVPASSGMRRLAQLIERARKRETGLTYGSLGAGSTGQVSAEMLLSLAGLKGTEVPYRGEALAMTDLISGQLDFMAAGISVALPHITSGKVVALAVTGAQRSAALPEVTTVAEAGYKDYEVTQWYGVYVAAQTPADVQAKVIAASRAALSTPEMQRQITSLAMEPTDERQRNFAAFDARERARWAVFVRRSRSREE